MSIDIMLFFIRKDITHMDERTAGTSFVGDSLLWPRPALPIIFHISKYSCIHFSKQKSLMHHLDLLE
jgi:hypothetical protein